MDHQCSIRPFPEQVLCERRPTFGLFMWALLVRPFLWNNFPDLSFICVFKRLQHLSQLGIASPVLRRLDDIFLGSLFWLFFFLLPNFLGFFHRWMNGKLWKKRWTKWSSSTQNWPFSCQSAFQIIHQWFGSNISLPACLHCGETSLFRIITQSLMGNTYKLKQTRRFLKRKIWIK